MSDYIITLEIAHKALNHRIEKLREAIEGYVCVCSFIEDNPETNIACDRCEALKADDELAK